MLSRIKDRNVITAKLPPTWESRKNTNPIRLKIMLIRNHQIIARPAALSKIKLLIAPVSLLIYNTSLESKDLYPQSPSEAIILFTDRVVV